MAQELYELPDGWEWKELNSICEKTENIAPNKTPSVQFNYVDISAIDREKHIIAEVKEILGKDAPSRAKKEIKPNDILFATTRPNLKNIAIYDTYLERPVASTGFCILRCKQGTSHNYIFRFLLTDHLQNQISDFISGAQYPAITDKNLKRSKIPVPPLAEQERIVAKLDALFSRIDQAIAQLQHTQSQTKALWNSALDARMNVSGVKTTFDDAKIDNTIGLVKNLKQQSETLSFTYLKMNNITRDGHLDLKNATKCDASELEVERYSLRDRDFLFNTRNSAELVGKTCLFITNATSAPVLFNNNIMRVRFREDILPEYIAYQFKTSHVSNQLEAIKSNTTNVSAIYYKKLKDIELNIPPLAEQSKIVAQLDAISERTQALTAATSAQLEQLQSLKASLLDAAFRGQLPSDQ